MLCSEEYRDIEEKVLRGERLSRADGIRLFHCRDIAWLGALADTVRRRKCGDVVYYNVNCHVNLTNICTSRCKFCAFGRDEGDAGAYAMTKAQAIAVVRDAMRCPGGAYYRVNHRQVRDMHAALAEVGILYVTLMVHDGWFEPGPGTTTISYSDGGKSKSLKLPIITRKGHADGGHAVAIVGYAEQGFIIQNSWGPGWGAGGFALLPYEDYMLHATDVWVAQLGVPVSVDVWAEEEKKNDKVSEGAARALPAMTLDSLRPYVIDVGNNGELSGNGDYWTTPEDLKRLVTQDIPATTKAWPTRRVMLYLHGGLNDEKSAAKRVAAMRGPCLANEIYPLHVMWETGFMESLKSYFGDWFTNADKLSGRSLIDSVGVAPFTAACEALAAQYGERFAPPALLIADSRGINFLIRDRYALDPVSRKMLDRFL